MLVYLLVQLVALLVSVDCYTINPDYSQHNDITKNKSFSLEKRATDPSDFSWTKKWACIGDSFSAGIGSGNVWSNRKADVQCSRYDYSYPAILNKKLGPAVKTFEYWACSGDKTVDIHNQVVRMNVYNQLSSNLGNNLDFVTLTAGGNDLCLSDMIKSCIMFPAIDLFMNIDDAECNALIEKAQFNMDYFLGENIKSILRALNDKMNTGGLVVYNLYAEYFSEETEECAETQEFAFPKILAGLSLKLTTARRKKLNDLVRGTNAVIQKAVDEISADPSIRYKIETSDWGVWPKDAVAGQMCEPWSSGHYPDERSPALQFFKPRTSVYDRTAHQDLKRSMSPEAQDKILKQYQNKHKRYWENSILYQSADPRAIAKSRLDPRAPVPPGCPGDHVNIFAVPDRVGRFFHPNELGHETIASFAIATLVGMRASQLNVRNPYCDSNKDEFRCWKKEGGKAYANPDQLGKSVAKFCNSVKQPANTVGWRWEQKYLKDTLDEHIMSIQLTSKASAFDKNQCVSSMMQLIEGCDGNDSNNPLNADGYCSGTYHFSHSSYTIRGSGFSTWDYGQETLLPAIKGCLGLGVTAWSFKYFDKPDGEVNEWEATFNTPVFVNARCFRNNKVVFSIGGFTHGCHGNDP
ncbi:hypothetical protein HYFRA_00009167 [Hymenoscyphus fraxineus]|uniref:SGNH hydrolase-type esterase domain-containing protein n=1 Tax=Hymenoscyphus fraxineus TaxID=746836 RepID=A0A9N9PNY7_9HELO|nr:hypothetical protein HYFRA_00009167 [Hymenoscyphus fraxineus]